jgi:anti-anti-sigma factor
MTNRVSTSGTDITLYGEMTIYHAAALKEAIGAAVAQIHGNWHVHLSEVTELDTAGVQLLLGLREYARQRACELRFVQPSAMVREVLELLQIPSLDQAVEGQS